VVQGATTAIPPDATKALDTLPLSATHVALPDVPSATQEPRSDPRLTPRLLDLIRTLPYHPRTCPVFLFFGPRYTITTCTCRLERIAGLGD